MNKNKSSILPVINLFFVPVGHEERKSRQSRSTVRRAILTDGEILSLRHWIYRRKTIVKLQNLVTKVPLNRPLHCHKQINTEEGQNLTHIIQKSGRLGSYKCLLGKQTVTASDFSTINTMCMAIF